MLSSKERMDKWASKRSPRFGKNRKNSRYQNDSWAARGEVKKRQILEKEERYPSKEDKFSRYL